MTINYLIFLIFLWSKLTFSARIRSDNYIDNCDYSFWRNYECGDICLPNTKLCTCGDEVIDDWGHVLSQPNSRYCCTSPSYNCTKTFDGATCFLGEVSHVYEEPPCYGRCWNDYKTSETIGPQSMFACPDKCISIEDMCQGVSFCQNDEDICGKDLRCPNEKSYKNISSGSVRHHYCYDHGHLQQQIITGFS